MNNSLDNLTIQTSLNNNKGKGTDAFQCANKVCNWRGYDNDREWIAVNTYQLDATCPNCGNNEFYSLIEK